MQDLNSEVIDLLKKITRHKAVKLTNSGNAAIFAALYLCKIINPRPVVAIPDQGGWISYKTYPDMLGFEIVEVKTDRGLIDLNDLEIKTKNASCFIVTSFAGYFAEQDIKSIKEVCRKNKCLLIEDAAGGIGDKILCNGEISDIIVGSFGKAKPVNLGHGGFISVSKKEWFENNDEIFSMFKHSIDLAALKEKLLTLDKRHEFFKMHAQNIKRDLDGFEIIHKDSRGINVCAAYKSDLEKQKIIDYCKSKDLEYTECPRYIRVNENAISIEIKRL